MPESSEGEIELQFELAWLKGIPKGEKVAGVTEFNPINGSDVAI